MSLADLIRGKSLGKPATAIPATAIPATAATEGRDKGLSVARIATIAVANPDTDTEALTPAEQEAYRELLAIRAMREAGQVPTHYTAKTVCAHCGVVPIFAGVPANVDACPWCFNRVKGLPVPRIGDRGPTTWTQKGGD